MQMVDDYRTGISRIERAKVAAQAVIDTLSARDWGSISAVYHKLKIIFLVKSETYLETYIRFLL